MDDYTQNKDAQIAKVQSDVLSVDTNALVTIGQLEQSLLLRFPAEDAEEWDKTGLLVGDASQKITGVAIALDVTSHAISQAASCGANVLLTHHPVFIDPPSSFGPLSLHLNGTGAAIYQAIRENIALINLHTALDVSKDAQQVLPSMLGLVQNHVLCPIDSSEDKGYGQVCHSDEALSLEQFAARCVSVFNRIPRVWGRPMAKMKTIVTATGSGGSLFEACLNQGIDCLICGEVRYHDALAAAEAGLCIIELGHDVSELPLAAVLAAACEQVGISKDCITILDQSGNWWTPEAFRR